MLEKIRNQVAKDSSFDDWDDLCFCHGEMESIKRFEELTKFCDEVSQRYARSKTQEIQEQNADLVNMLAMVIDVWGYEYEGSTAYKKVDELLTKHNHLNQKQ